MIVRLRAHNAFLEMLGEVRKVDAIVLCEGAREALAVEKVGTRLGAVGEKKNVAIVDSEGLDALRTGMLPAILAFIVKKVVRKAKAVGVLIDMEELNYESRLRGLLDSVRAREYEVGEPERVCRATWRTVVSTRQREVPVVVSISGLPEFPLERHTIEDHLLQLKILEGRESRDVVNRIKRAEEAVSREDARLLDEARESNLGKAFEHVLCLLKSVDP